MFLARIELAPSAVTFAAILSALEAWRPGDVSQGDMGFDRKQVYQVPSGKHLNNADVRL